MTIINRLCPELSDIVGVQLECNKCHATISCPPASWTPGFLNCPNCSVTLVRFPEANSPELAALMLFADGLKKLLTPSEERKFRLRLELRTTAIDSSPSRP